MKIKRSALAITAIAVPSVTFASTGGGVGIWHAVLHVLHLCGC